MTKEIFGRSYRGDLLSFVRSGSRLLLVLTYCSVSQEGLMSRLVSQAPRTAGFWLGLDKGWCQGEMEGCVPERKVFLLFFFRLCLQQLLVSSVGSILTGSESRFSNNPGFWALAKLSVPFVFFILRVVVAWLPLLQLIWLLNPSSTCVKNCLH